MAEPATSYDVAVIGAGVDGLVAAAVLARAGRRVVVLEDAAHTGGLLANDEIAPQVQAPAVFSSVETLAPEVLTELDLEAHGLRLSDPGPVLVATGDERSRLFAPPGASAVNTRHLRALADAGLRDEDVRAFEAYDGFLRRVAEALAPILAAPLPAFETTGPRHLLALMRPLLRLRRLGAAPLAELLRFLPMPLHDIATERFADPALRIAVAAAGLPASWMGPRSPGGGLNLALHRCALGRGALAHPRFAHGGPGALAEALRAAARAAGAALRTAAAVSAVGLTGRGESLRATGVELADGERVEARAVLSTRDPKTTFFDLVGACHGSPSWVAALDAVRSRGTVATVAFVLDAPPVFAHAGEDPRVLAGRILVTGSLDDLERAFDDAKYGRLPRRPFLDVTVPTAVDPSLAPAGRHVVHAWVQYPPFHLRGGDWDDAREALGDQVQATLAAVSPGFAERVLVRRVLTPADLARRFGLREGCVYQVEPALDQALFMRPMPRWYRYATPIAGLYLGGPATHGGLGISGLAGRNAARVLDHDLRAG